MRPGEEWKRDFLAALGNLLVQSGYLEDALIDLYWIVSGKSEPELLKCVRGKPLGEIKKIAVTAYEGRISDADLRSRLDAIKPELGKAIDTRNEFVHAVWAFGNEVAQRERWPRTGPVVGQLRKMTIADVEDATELIFEVFMALSELREETVERIPQNEIQPRSGIVMNGVYIPGGSEYE